MITACWRNLTIHFLYTGNFRFYPPRCGAGRFHFSIAKIIPEIFKRRGPRSNVNRYGHKCFKIVKDTGVKDEVFEGLTNDLGATIFSLTSWCLCFVFFRLPLSFCYTITGTLTWRKRGLCLLTASPLMPRNWMMNSSWTGTCRRIITQASVPLFLFKGLHYLNRSFISPHQRYRLFRHVIAAPR
jgi:hypothetical protein